MEVQKQIVVCGGEKCFYWTTFFWYKGKKLKHAIIRCGTRKCILDGESTDEVNADLKKKYPIEYENEN